MQLITYSENPYRVHLVLTVVKSGRNFNSSTLKVLSS